MPTTGRALELQLQAGDVCLPRHCSCQQAEADKGGWHILCVTNMHCSAQRPSSADTGAYGHQKEHWLVIPLQGAWTACMLLKPLGRLLQHC